MKRIVFFILIFCVISTVIKAQDNKICDEINHKKVSYDILVNHKVEFLQDIKILIDCEFEPIDFQIFGGPKQDFSVFSVLLLGGQDNAKNNIYSTYGDLSIFMKEFKKTKEYIKVREIAESTNELKTKPATIDNWRKDVVLLRKLNFDDNAIRTIKDLVKKNKDKSLSYADLLSNNMELIFPKENKNNNGVEKKKTIHTETMIKFLGDVLAFDDYEKGKQKSRETNKPLLIYFTGHMCMECREMEYEVLVQQDILKIIKSDFVIVKLFTDDVASSLPKQDIYYSEILKKEVKNKGDFRTELQIQKFNSNSKPFFAILSPDGKELKRIEFTLNKNEFRKFLSLEK